MACKARLMSYNGGVSVTAEYEPLSFTPHPQRPACGPSLGGETQGLSSSGECFVVVNGRKTSVTGDQIDETRGRIDLWKTDASSCTSRREIARARLLRHVKQCHRRDWPSCRHHKALITDRTPSDISAPEWVARKRTQAAGTLRASLRSVGAATARSHP